MLHCFTKILVYIESPECILAEIGRDAEMQKFTKGEKNDAFYDICKMKYTKKSYIKSINFNNLLMNNGNCTKNK